MAFADEEFDDDLAVARLAWLAQGDQAALDQACDVCLSYLEVDLGIRGRAIGLLAPVLYGTCLPEASDKRQLPPDGCPALLVRSWATEGDPFVGGRAHQLGWSAACRSASRSSAAAA
jgi:hypothetical protein